ncbi:hypothetical protein AB0395_41225 [Streptosporangium sp. NPDC051023]|uniref:hypothetical protein n=1 Tax=Streptosporangium sp. NPDC051023 TaxID=3155410 RepID=UPI00344E72D9
MSSLRIRDEYGNEFEVDASARPFWEHREGYTILGLVPDPGEEPTVLGGELAPAQSVEVVQSQPAGLTTPKPERVKPTGK